MGDTVVAFLNALEKWATLLKLRELAISVMGILVLESSIFDLSIFRFEI